MLPFLDSKKAAGRIMAKRGDKMPVDVANEVEAPGNDRYPALNQIGEEMLRAIESKSPLELAHAIMDAVALCQAQGDDEPMEDDK